MTAHGDQGWDAVVQRLRIIHARRPEVLSALEALLALLRARSLLGPPRVTVGWLSYPVESRMGFVSISVSTEGSGHFDVAVIECPSLQEVQRRQADLATAPAEVSQALADAQRLLPLASQSRRR